MTPRYWVNRFPTFRKNNCLYLQGPKKSERTAHVVHFTPSENTLYPEGFHIVFSVMINSHTLYPLTNSHAKITRVTCSDKVHNHFFWGGTTVLRLRPPP